MTRVLKASRRPALTSQDADAAGLPPRHDEHHRTKRVGWLRAAVLGANDGLVSTASLVLGVAAADAAHSDVLIAGCAGLMAGAMSMAAGEYVSVSSQADAERADRERERLELEKHPSRELAELTEIYVERGLDARLARRVAKALTAHDALAAHIRDELGLSEEARPWQAALASAVAFASAAAVPLLVMGVLSAQHRMLGVGLSSVAGLGLLGAWSAYLGGAPPLKAALRVVLWGALAMAATTGMGALIGQLME